MPSYHAPGARKGNETWVVRGYVNGKQRECVTPSSSKRGAQKYWDDWSAEIRKLERTELRDRETETFDNAADQYAADHELSAADARYVAKLKTYFAGWYLKDMTYQDIHRAARELYPRTKPQTQNRQAVKPGAAILHHAAAARKCDHLVIPHLVEVDPIRPLAYPEELTPYIRAAQERNDKALAALISTFQIQAWRVGETLKVERDKIDWGRLTILRWVSKSQEWRTAAVDAELMRLWALVPEHPSGRLFGAYTGRHAVYAAIDALGLPGRFRPHMARRGFVTSLRDLHVPLEDIAGAGQWKDIKSVMVYDRDNPERARDTLEILRGKLRGDGVKSV